MRKLLACLFGLWCLLVGAASIAQIGPIPGMGPLPINRRAAVPKVLTFQGSINTLNTQSAFSYSVSIGAATADRIVYLASCGIPQGSLSSITINGLAANQVVAVTHSFSTFTAANEIVNASVPTGSTASVVVSYTGASSGNVIGIWTSTGVSSLTPNATGSTTTNSATVTLSTLAGGFALGGTCDDTTVSGTVVTFSGLTLRYALSNANIAGASATTSGGTANFSATESLVGDGPTAVYASW